MRSERKAGQFLADMKEEGIIKQGGDQKSKAHDVTLKSIGVERVESQRWQRIAGIPEERFEEYLHSQNQELPYVANVDFQVSCFVGSRCHDVHADLPIKLRNLFPKVFPTGLVEGFVLTRSRKNRIDNIPAFSRVLCTVHGLRQVSCLKIAVLLSVFLSEVKSTTKGSHGRSPNDQRSIVKNPTSPEYKAVMDNRSVQLSRESQKHESGKE